MPIVRTLAVSASRSSSSRRRSFALPFALGMLVAAATYACSAAPAGDPADPQSEPRDEAGVPAEAMEDPLSDLTDGGSEAADALTPIPSEAGTVTLVPIVVAPIPFSAGNRSGQKFATQQLFITVHETNNPSSNALGERAFFHSGGGSSVVSVHFAVDDERVVQLLPLDEMGKHSGSTIGNQTSIAIETCVATTMDFAKVRRNLAQLIARIAAGDGTLSWGDGTTKSRFSLQRLRMHNDWSPANPCPRHIRKENFWPTLMTWVDEAADDIKGL